MPAPIQPAVLSLAPDGTPYSPVFDDVYHTSAGGLGQARHVFLEGNGLPERWRGRHRWVIIETGFGLGLNFLATWQAWRDDPARSNRLDFISIEKHPFQTADLARLHAAWPELAALADELLFGRLSSGGTVTIDLDDNGKVALQFEEEADVATV